MPIFNWNQPSTCESPSLPLCDPPPVTKQASGLVVYDQDSNCQAKLGYGEAPAIVMDLGGEVKTVSGSHDEPMKLPHIKKVLSMMADRIVSQSPDGTMSAWQPNTDCLTRRVVFNGDAKRFELVEDINSNVFSNQCIGSYSDVDYVAGVTTFQDCAGNTKLKLVFFPKSQLPNGS